VAPQNLSVAPREASARFEKPGPATTVAAGLFEIVAAVI